MRSLLRLASILLILLLPAFSSAYAKPIRIGLMAPLTGSFANEGQDMQKVVASQVEALNNAGGINGTPVELVTEDDGSLPRSAVNAANRLISRGIQYVIGTYGSSLTEATQDIYDEVGVIQIATGATSIRLTSKGFKRFFRTSPRDDDQGRVIVKTVEQLHCKKLAILHDNSAYGKGLAEQTKRILEEKDETSVIFYDALQANERDYTAILTKIKGVMPDVIIFTGYYPEAGMLLRQMVEMKWSIPMIGGDATNNKDLVNIAGVNAAKGYRFISPPVPSDLTTATSLSFLAAYQKKYSSTPSSIWSVTAGDAFTAFVHAIEKVGDNPEAVSTYLHTLKNLDVLTGTLGFDDKGDRVGDLYRVYEVDAQGNFILQK